MNANDVIMQEQQAILDCLWRVGRLVRTTEIEGSTGLSRAVVAEQLVLLQVAGIVVRHAGDVYSLAACRIER